MARIDTLTAYSCKFRYLQRNNPLIEELRETIKQGTNPNFSFSDFISLYSEHFNNLLIGKNSDRAISLSENGISDRKIKDIKAWYISPMAGKQGQPMTVVKQTTGKKYNFGADAAALYNYNIFVYESEEAIIIVFHRQNSSGCKSVFLETANNILKAKGLKMEMELIVSLTDEVSNATASKITLQYVEQNNSSDITDNINKKKKKVIRDLGLNLEAKDNLIVANIIKNYQLGKISKDVAFAQIKKEVKNVDNYNDAEIALKIGNRTRHLPWNEFEHVFGVHDISTELHTAYKKSKKFIEELTKLSDNYYYEIMNSGVATNE